MYNISPLVPFHNTFDYLIEKESVPNGSMQHRKAVAIITDEQFSQYGVQNRIRKLIIYSPIEIQGFTDAGNKTIIHANWPDFSSQEHFARYLERAFIVITQMNDGEYQLRASVRIVGGGNDQSTGKNTQKPTTTRPPIRVNPPPQQQLPIVQRPIKVAPPPSKDELTAKAYIFKDRLWHALFDNKLDEAMVVVDEIINYKFFWEISYLDDTKRCVNICLENNFPAGFSKLFKKLGYKRNEHDSLDKISGVGSCTRGDSRQEEMLRCLFDHGLYLDNKYNPLEVAARYKWTDTLEYMLSKRADPNLFSDIWLNDIVLDRACNGSDHLKNKKIVDLLIAAGAKAPNPIYNKGDLRGATIRNGWNDILTFLINNGVPFTSTDLCYAIDNERIEMIPVLIANGANPSEANFQRWLLKAKPQIRELVDKQTKDNPEFLNTIKKGSTKIIRSLQGDLYSKVESAEKLQELEDTLTTVLSSSSVFRESYYKILPESERISKPQALIDCVSKKLNEVMISSFYFDAGKGLLRTTEIQEELKEAIVVWSANDSKITSEKQRDLNEKIKQRELLEQQLQQQADFEKQRMEQEKQRMEQEREIAENQSQEQANALQRLEEARKKETDELKKKLDQIKNEIRYY